MFRFADEAGKPQNYYASAARISDTDMTVGAEGSPRHPQLIRS